jgi:hypothetical protein
MSQQEFHPVLNKPTKEEYEAMSVKDKEKYESILFEIAGNYLTADDYDSAQY